MTPILLVTVIYIVRLSAAHPTAVPNQPNGWDSHFGNNLTSVIQLLHSEEKSYYFGFHFKVTYFQAAQFCEDIHMKLVSIENANENNRLYKYVRDANKGDFFWTSGAKLLDGKHWVWMNNGKPVDYTNWAPGNPDSLVEHCMAAYHSRNVGLPWADRDCLVQLGFICERRRRGANESLTAQNEVSHWNTVYENPYMSANVPLFHTNDKSYFLGRYFKATFQEAIHICHMMNMKLVSIVSKEENDRIFKYIRDTNAGDSFWTSGTRIVDGITWIWMTTAQLVNYTNWYTGQPDSVIDHCLQLLAQKDKGLFWVDSGCLLRFYYICEKPRDIILFDRRTIVTKQGIDLKSTNFPLVQMETRTFYLGHHFKSTQLEASNFCQRTNMQLVSITTEEENEEVRQLLLHYSAPTDSFWTSARRSNVNDKWTWATGLTMEYSRLQSKGKKDSLCIELFHNATWGDQLCDEQRFFICEKINKVQTCPKVAPILNVYVNGDAGGKNISLPYAFFKIANATFDTVPEVVDVY